MSDAALLRTTTLAMIALFGAGAALPILPSAFRTTRTTGNRIATWLSLLLSLVGSVVAAGLALFAWSRPGTVTAILFTATPAPGFPALTLSLAVDRLSAFFLLLVGVFSAAVALYSFVWLQDSARQQHRIAGLYSVFVLSTILLVLSDDAFYFMLFLETMTLSFGFLALYRHDKLLAQGSAPAGEMRAAKTAFKTYLIASHIGVVFISAAFLPLAIKAGEFGFAAFREGAATFDPALATPVFLLALVGFGIKAGIWPANVWVPIVHPYSPTTTHALTLGLLIKVVSIYPMIRVFFQFLPVAGWWGYLVLSLAGLTAITGVFYALTGRDLKTALANHSVENVGIILAGVGVGLIFANREFDGQPWLHNLTGLALMAALYHTLNHAVFKGLLYLGTGAIENRTGTVKMEALGGLMRRFPWTAVTFLVGAVSIAGFPPFNGFVSEWLTLQSIFAGLELLATPPSLWRFVGLIPPLLLLAAAFGLTALAFVKIAGETLLGAPRRPEVLAQERQGDVPWAMRGVLVVLALACLALGIMPATVVGEMAPVVCGLRAENGFCTDPAGETLPYVHTETATLALRVTDRQTGTQVTYAADLQTWPLLFPAGLVVLLAVALAQRHRKKKPAGPEENPVWTSGSPYRPGEMQITGGAFASLVLDLVPFLSGREDGDDPAGALPVALPLSPGHVAIDPIRRLYNGAIRLLLRASTVLGNWVQDGDVRKYLIYILIALLAVLAYLAQGGN